MKAVDKNFLFLVIFTVYLFLCTNLGGLFGITKMTTFSFVVFYLLIVVSCPYWFKYLKKNNDILYYLLFVLLYILVGAVFAVKIETILSLTMLPFTLLFFKPWRRDYKNVRFILLSFFILECAVAIAERVLGIWILPADYESGFYASVINGLGNDTWKFRAASLLGHPLFNANFVTMALSVLLLSSFNLKIKLLCYVLGVLALFSFNSRFAIIIGSMVSTIILYTQLMKSGNNQYKRWLNIIFGFLVIIYFANYLITSEWGGRIMNSNLMDDSAKTRLNWIDYLSRVSLFPNSYTDIDKSENSFVFILLNHGIVFGLPLIYFYLRFMMMAIKDFSVVNKVFLLLSFFVVGMSNNNLSNPRLLMYFIIYVTAFNSSIRGQSGTSRLYRYSPLFKVLLIKSLMQRNKNE